MRSERAAAPRLPADVYTWFENVTASILAHRSQVLHALSAGETHATARFIGMTREEVDEVFAADRLELELATVLTILAAAEAAVWIDYDERVKGRFKDPLSLAYRELQRPLGGGERPSFGRAVLGAMVESRAVPLHVVSAFRDVRNLRHWLAHGRHWLLRLGGTAYAPDDVLRTVEALLAALS